MSDHQAVCPWWMCFTFDNVFRRLTHDPQKILGRYLRPGWTVLDVGPGMGYFTIPAARMVGKTGKVIAADLQKRMLETLQRRAVKAGVADRIRLLQCTPDKLGVAEPLDFCLAFWMVHEVQDKPRFIGEIVAYLKPGGLFLLVEPKFHVAAKDFAKTLDLAVGAGLIAVEQPHIAQSYTILLRKP